MKIKNVEFVKGIRGTDKILKDGIPQIAFAGRSNVGKSSMINSLLGRKDLVKTSSLPGKTREANFFSVTVDLRKGGKDKTYYFVDLPGYGFAKIKTKAKDKLRKLIIWYLSSEETISRKVILILDVNVGPTDFDLETVNLLRQEGREFLIVANKADKLRQKDVKKQLKLIQDKTEVSADNIFLYSAKTKKGREQLLEKILG